MLPEDQDLSQIGVKNNDLHFITAGSKGQASVLNTMTPNSKYNTKVSPNKINPDECTSSSKNTCPHPSLTGVLRVWEASTSCCVYSQTLPPAGKEGGEPHDGDNPCSLTYLLTMGASARVAAVTAEHNITLYQLPTLSTQQQVGRPATRQEVWVVDCCLLPISIKVSVCVLL